MGFAKIATGDFGRSSTNNDPYLMSCYKKVVEAGDLTLPQPTTDICHQFVAVASTSAPTSAPPAPPAPCPNNHPDCAYWASVGECERNPDYMLVNCMESCGACQGPPPPQPTPAPTTPAPTPTPSTGCVELLIVGDFGDSGSDQRDVRAGMAKVAEERNPDGILALGDNVYPSGVESNSDMQNDWRDIWLQESALQRPWYGVLGNHDWWGNAEKMRDFTNSSRNEGGYWTMPGFWHNKDFGGGVEVFLVDTMIWRGDAIEYGGSNSQMSNQRDWLSDRLQQSSASWKIVAGHHPVYSAGSHGITREILEEVDPMMRSNGANIYLAGHDHSQQHIKHQNMHYVVSGAGSKQPRTRSNESDGVSRRARLCWFVDLR